MFSVGDFEGYGHRKCAPRGSLIELRKSWRYKQRNEQSLLTMTTLGSVLLHSMWKWGKYNQDVIMEYV